MITANDATTTLIGSKCWHVSVGGATWPSFLLALGGERVRAKPLVNPRSPRRYRENRGERELIVWTGWRLTRDCHYVCTSSDGRRRGRSLRQIEGSHIVEASMGDLGDLTLRFSGGWRLDVFNNRSATHDDTMNWELWCGERWVGIDADLALAEGA